MSIWHLTSSPMTIEKLQSLGHNTMGAYLGMEFTEIGEN